MPKAKLSISSCTVQKLDGENIIIETKNLKTGQDLLDEVCKSIGLEEEKVYFGLRYHHPADGKISWFDTNKPLQRQLKKASHKLNFGVQFYPANYHEIKHDFTRYQFVLQAREHFLTGYWSCSVPTEALLASYIAQAEFGNYDASIHDTTYLNDLIVMPTQANDFMEKVCSFHQKHKDLKTSDVDWLYLDNARKTGLYGMELYEVSDSDDNIMKLGISTSGIHILHMNTVLHTFLWPAVINCTFRKRQIFINLKVCEKAVTVAFLASSRTEAKRIASNCGLIKHFSIHGKRKIKIKRKKETAPSDTCAHSSTDDVVEEKEFSRIDSKRFSRRFLKEKSSLTLDLPISPGTDPKNDKEDLGYTGDVYLGYSSKMPVPTITETAPSEQSLPVSSAEPSPVKKISPQRKAKSSSENNRDTPKHQPPEVDGEKGSKASGTEEENVEIIEVVKIDYVNEHKNSVDDPKSSNNDVTNTEEQEEEVTSKVVEIKIIGSPKQTTKEESKMEDKQEEGELKLNDAEKEIEKDDSCKSIMDQEAFVIYGNETIESIDDSSCLRENIDDNGLTLLESIEKELNDSFEIVKGAEEEEKVVAS